MGGRMWWQACVVAMALGASGCAKTPVVKGPRLQTDTLLELVRSRPVPNPSQSRFSIKFRLAKQGVNPPRLGGGLVIDRPTRAYVAILDPVGSPVLTLASNGERVVLMNNRDKQYVAQEQVEDAIRELTSGAVTLSDLIDLFVGLLPLDQAAVTSKQETDDGVKFTFEGPGGIAIAAWVDGTNGTPRRIEVDNAAGVRVVNAAYEPFEDFDGELMPSSISIDAPEAEITVNLRFKTWKLLESPPDVFSPSAPDNFTVMTFAEFAEGMRDTVGDE